MRTLAALAVAFFLALSPLGAGAQCDPPKPNFVIIVADDLRVDDVSFMPQVAARLINHGVTFSRSFTTTPACCPNRTSAWTGRYNHHLQPDLGTTPAKNWRAAGTDAQSLAPWLDAAGYRTALFGKYLNGNEEGQGVFGVGLSPVVPPGWDEWHTMGHQGYLSWTVNHNGVMESRTGYSTDYFAEEARAFIAAQTPATPFFMVYAPWAPHASEVSPGHAPVPAERHANAFPDLPPYDVVEMDRSDKPAWLQAVGQPTAEFINSYRRVRLRAALAVDDAVALLVDQLVASGLATKTVIIFVSDNGFMLGEHGYTNKLAAYEDSIAVPMVWVVPWLLGAPRVESRLALNIDIAPTVMQMAGVPWTAPFTPNGASLVPVLKNEATPGWRTDFLIENHLAAWPVPPMWWGVRTTEWKYVKNDLWLFQPGTDTEELYNLVADPLERDNLLVTAPYLTEVQDMVAALRVRLAFHLSQ